VASRSRATKSQVRASRPAVRPLVRPSAPLRRDAVGASRIVHREYEGRTPRRLDATHERCVHVPAPRGVELEPDRLAPGLVHLFDGGRGDVGEDHEVVVRCGRARNARLGIGMEGPVAPRRRKDERGRPGSPEEGGTGVDVRHACEPSGADVEPLEALPVAAQRRLVVRARLQVGPVRGRHVPGRHALQVEHVQRVVGARGERGLPDEDGARGRSRRLQALPSGPGVRRHTPPELGGQGARGEPAEEGPAIDGAAHRRSSLAAAQMRPSLGSASSSRWRAYGIVERVHTRAYRNEMPASRATADSSPESPKPS